MAYYYTPQSQIDAAKRRISSNDAAQETALSSYLAMMEQSAETVPQAQADDKSDAGFFRRALDTSTDFFKSITVGLGKAFEGFLDFTMSATGVVGGWFGDDELKDQMSEFVAVDAVGDWMRNLEENSQFLAAKDSYINDMSERGQRIVRGVGEGIGQMLPMIALTAATGGLATAAEGSALAAGKGAVAAAKTASAIRKAGQIGNLALLGMSAAGTGTEQALNYEIDNGDGSTSRPSLDKAFLYGLVSGAVEVATERLVGGPYEKVFGSGVADKLINKLAKSTAFEKAVRFAIGAVGEGVEEVVSEAVSNTLQTIYKSDHPHLESPDVQAMFEAGVIGAITSAVMSGGNVAVRKASNTMSVQDHVTDARNIERKLENLSAAESLDESTANRLQAEYERNMQGIVKRYNAASEKARARMYATTPGLAQYINEDGTRRTTELGEGVQALTADQTRSSAMSQALLSRANEVANDLHEKGTTVATNMTTEETENIRKLRTALKQAGSSTGTTLKVVVAENLAQRNAFIKGDVMYISRDRVGTVATMAEDFAHESTHFAEGTKQHEKLAKFLASVGDGKLWAKAIAEVHDLSTANGVEKGYNISDETFEAFVKGDRSGLTAEQLKEWELLYSEVVAKCNELVLGGKQFGETVVNDLVEKDRSLAKSWLERIKRTIEIVQKTLKGDTEAANTLKWLRKAEHRFESALAASGEKYLRAKTGKKDEVETDEQESKRVDKNSKKSYNKQYYNQHDTELIKWANRTITKPGEVRAFFNARTNTWSIAVATIDEQGRDYTILKVVDDTDYNVRLIEEIQGEIENESDSEKQGDGESVSQDYETFERQFDQLRGDGVDDANQRRNERVGGLHEDTADTDRESNSRQSNRDKRKGVDPDEQHSLRSNTNSEGEQLSNEQVTFFKKTKVVDNEGNLLKVYHGTMSGKFNVFDASKANVESDMGAGFYFSSSYDDVGSNYERGGQDLDTKIERLAEQIEAEEEIDYEEAKEKARAQLVKSSHLYEVYLNMKNPAYVGGAYDNATMLFSDVFEESELDIDDYDDEENYYEDRESEIDERLEEVIEEVSRVLDGENIYGYEGWTEILADIRDHGGITIKDLKDALAETIPDCENDMGDIASNEVLRAIVQALGYDGIIDNSVVDKWGHNSGRKNYMQGMDENTRHYIVFSPNQIKLTTNEHPTSDPDIRYSLRSSLAAERQYTREEIDALLAEVFAGESEIFKGYSIKNSEGVRRHHTVADVQRAARSIAAVLHTEDGIVDGKLSKTALKQAQALVDEFWKNPTDNVEERAWEIANKILALATGEDNRQAEADEDKRAMYKQIRAAGLKLKNSLSMDDFITGELRHAFDEDGFKGLRLQWGARKGEGMGYDQFAQAIVEENGIEAYAEYAVNEDAYKPEDVIIDFFKKYQEASRYLSQNEEGVPITELLDDNGLDELRGKIARVLLYSQLGFDVTDNGYTLRTDGMKGAIGEYVWQQLRKTDGEHRAKAIDQVAEYIMQSVMLQDANAAIDAAEGKAILNVLKQHLGKVDLSSVKRALASDEKGYKSITSRWSGKGGLTVNEFLAKIKEAGIRLRATGTAEQMLELDALYDEARAAVDGAKRTAAKSVSELFNDTERAAIKQDLVTRIEAALKGKGEATKLAELVQHYEETIKEQRRLLKEGKIYNKEVNRVLDLIEKLKPNGKKHYKSGTYLKDPMFTDVCKLLGKIKYRSDIRKSGTRGLIAALGKWYNKANPLLNGGLDATAVDNALKQEHTCGYLNSDMLEVIDYFAAHVTDKGVLTLDEMTAVRKLLQHIDKLVRDYDVVEIDGKRLRLSEEATKSITSAEKYVGLAKHSWGRELIRRFGYSIIEPYAVLEDLCGYEDNALLRAYEGILAGETKAGAVRLEIIAPIEDFLKEHKKYKTRLVKDKITIAGREVPVDVGLSLYMIAKQEAAHAGLTQNGWGYYDKLKNWVDCGVLTDEDIAAIEGELSQADKDYLKAVRQSLDVAGKYMSETQLDIGGWTDIVVEGSDYFPIRRYAANFVQSAEMNAFEYFAENIAASPSSVKARVENAHSIAAQPINYVLETHARQAGNYAGLAKPIKEFTRLYNANIAEHGRDPLTIHKTFEKMWNGSNNYIMTLLSDIQGMNGKKTLSDQIFDWMRGSYAKFQLGANIKVIFSQMASYPTAFAYLSTESMTKAFTKKLDGKDMDKYCAWARVRNHDHSIVLAESVTDKIGAVGDALTKPIQWTDRATIAMLWNACQFEVERQHKGDAAYKVGTEQNKIEAGKMLENVGRRTQPNYTASERSALQRSKSQIAKTFSMFSSVPLKQLSRLVESVGRERALRYRQKVLHENVSAAELKAAHVQTAKAITAVTVANLLYVAMGQLVKHILAKDRKDKEGNEIDVGIDFLKDFASTTVGMLPIVKEVYNAVINGYTNEDFVSSGFISFITSTKDVVGIIDKLAKGEVIEDKDIAVPLRSFAYALGQITGIPTRNAYNLVYGLIKRFDPAKAYEINSIFTSSATYSRDLKDAVEKGDENKAATILGLMLKDDGMTSTTPKVNEKLRSLYEQGYSVLPRTVKDTITYDGETIELSRRSQNAFKSIYGKANEEVEALINAKAFEGLDAEVQAKAIKWIYDLYYEKAVTETVGAEANSKRQLFAETMAPSKFAMAFAACSAAEGKVDRKGNTIAGSKRKAVTRLLNSLSLTRAEKALILAYLGYSVTDYAGLIKRYIGSIGLTKEQQKAFMTYVSA